MQPAVSERVVWWVFVANPEPGCQGTWDSPPIPGLAGRVPLIGQQIPPASRWAARPEAARALGSAQRERVRLESLLAATAKTVQRRFSTNCF